MELVNTARNRCQYSWITVSTQPCPVLSSFLCKAISPITSFLSSKHYVLLYSSTITLFFIEYCGALNFCGNFWLLQVTWIQALPINTNQWLSLPFLAFAFRLQCNPLMHAWSSQCSTCSMNKWEVGLDHHVRQWVLLAFLHFIIQHSASWLKECI